MQIPLWQCYKVNWPPVSLMISKIKSWTSMSIHLLSPIFLPWVTGSAGVYPSCFRVKEGLHTGQVTNLSLGHTERQTTIHTHLQTIKSCHRASLWTLGGRQSTCREPTQTLQLQWQCSGNCVVFLNNLWVWVMLIKYNFVNQSSQRTLKQKFSWLLCLTILQ